VYRTIHHIAKDHEMNFKPTIKLFLFLIYSSIVMSAVIPSLITLSSRRSYTPSRASLLRCSSTGPLSSSSKDVTGEEVVKTYLLEYKYVDNMVERRTPYRTGHIALAERYISEKLIVAGGAFVPKVDGAMFIFKSTRNILEAFVKEDPYVANGLVPEYTIREWNVVVGSV